jgi:hypothetical protein
MENVAGISFLVNRFKAILEIYSLINKRGMLSINRVVELFADEKDQEIQIGFPTDVKHVAHIGWDGPSANSTPSWVHANLFRILYLIYNCIFVIIFMTFKLIQMTEFKSPQESTGQLAVKELSAQGLAFDLLTYITYIVFMFTKI